MMIVLVVVTALALAGGAAGQNTGVCNPASYASYRLVFLCFFFSFFFNMPVRKKIPPISG